MKSQKNAVYEHQRITTNQCSNQLEYDCQKERFVDALLREYQRKYGSSISLKELQYNI